MLKKDRLAGKLRAFITKVNKMKQTDRAKAIDAFCKEHEEDVYDAIRSITITIPAGSIVVTGTALTQANANPIVLNNVVK